MAFEKNTEKKFKKINIKIKKNLKNKTKFFFLKTKLKNTLKKSTLQNISPLFNLFPPFPYLLPLTYTPP